MLGGRIAYRALGYVLRYILLYGLIGLLGSLMRAIAYFNHIHAYRLLAEFLALDCVREVDIQLAAHNFLTRIRDHVFARVFTGMPDLDAASDGQNVGVCRDYMTVSIFAGGGNSRNRVSRRNIAAVDFNGLRIGCIKQSIRQPANASKSDQNARPTFARHSI